jgi:hypothetical protein
MKMNGLLIDSARLLEPLPYYYRLITFMSDWNMNTLVLHFSDDSGLAVNLPGFEYLAMPHAVTAAEMREMIAFAKSRGIDIIPELETFAHSKYVTNHQRHASLSVSRLNRKNMYYGHGMDPLNPESHNIMKRLIAATAELFPSRFIHIGCDEVNNKLYCEKMGRDHDEVWAEYVNAMIAGAIAVGKTPIIWADHLEKSKEIARRIRKDVVVVDWRYEDDIKDTELPKLECAGFKNFLVAPSIACWLYRFLPTDIGMENTLRMARFGRRHNAMGLINTIWCPWRYLQGSIYYGIAYSSWVVRNEGFEKDEFHTAFAQKVFGTKLEPALRIFLDSWTKLRIDRFIAQKIYERSADFTVQEITHLKKMNRLGKKILAMAEIYIPEKNNDIWLAMVLAAKCAWICAESILIRNMKAVNAERRDCYNRKLSEIKLAMDAEWNRTRRPDDPQKEKPLFKQDADAYAMLLIRRLPRIKV